MDRYNEESIRMYTGVHTHGLAKYNNKALSTRMDIVVRMCGLDEFTVQPYGWRRPYARIVIIKYSIRTYTGVHTRGWVEYDNKAPSTRTDIFIRTGGLVEFSVQPYGLCVHTHGFVL